MKKILLLLTLLVSVFTFAQSNGITYQAVIYNSNGESIPGIQNPNSPLVNKSICLQFGIIDSNNLTEYQEKIIVTTDSFGMVNLIIGNGTQTGGYASSFDAIVWSDSQKYLKVSVDQTGNCSSFELISNQLLAYVPFALSANSATSVSGVVGIANGGTNANTVLGAKTNLQLQNIDNTSDLNKPVSTATQVALDSKVDKVTGKGLSTEDYTTAEKTKLGSLSNVDLTNYATISNLATKVDKVTGKGLSTEDFTTAEKTKLAGLNTTSGVPYSGATASVNLGNNNLQANQISGNSLIVGSVNNVVIGMKGTGETNYLGNGSMAYSSGGFANTAFGTLTLSETQGDENTALGSQAMRSNTTGARNTAVGRASLGGNLTGNNNTALGYNTRVSVNNLSNTTAIGANAIVGTSNTIQLGDTNITSVKTSGKLTTGTITLPNTDGTSGQVLSTNGSGVVSWTTPSTANNSNLVDLITNQIVAGNKTLSGITTVSNSTASTGTSSGALVVAGGTGIAGNLNIGGITTITNSTVSSAVTNGALVVVGGAGISGNINVGGNETISGSLGIGTTTTNSSAALEVNSTTKGILFPRVTLSQRDLIASPAKGLVVMCLDCGQTGGELGELQVFNGSRWTNAVGTDASGVSAGVGVPAIGSSFQGGKVAYILTPSDPGYESGKVKGIIAAPQDLSTSRLRLNNGTYISTIQNGNSAIGAGLNNTNLLYAAYGTSNTTTSPSYLAYNYSIVEGGVTYDDWFIPSKDELYKLYLNKAAIGNFSEIGTAEAVYWSSNYCNGNSGAGQYVRFTDGFISCNGTENSYRVRLVRYFTIEGKTSLTADTFNGDLNGNATTATNVTGVVAIANGGTGATTATGAINALLPSQSSANGKVLTSNGTNVSWTTVGGNTHYVGEAYGGGIVFYTYDNGAHGLIAGDGGNLTYKWSTAITPIAARSKGVLGGKTNSMLILSNMKIEGSTYAAQAANEYSVTSNGFTFGDWYLPSMDEMCLLKDFCIANSSNILTSGRQYWTSNDDDLRSDGVAWQFIYNGGATVCNDPGHRVQWRSALNYIVPIRSF